MNAAEFQAMANAPAAQGKLDCPWVAKFGSKPDVVASVAGSREALAVLNGYYAGFLGSPAALKGKKRSSTVVSNTEEQRKNLLLACGLQEAPFAHNETKELTAWGYGDTMVNVGCDVQQLASLRLQTQGYRQFIAIAASPLINFLKDKHKDSEGGVKLPMIATFVYQMSAADAAELITKMPKGSLQHCMMPPQTLAYLPPAWIMCEKVLNHKCCFVLRASLLTASEPSIVNLTALEECGRCSEASEADLAIMTTCLEIMRKQGKPQPAAKVPAAGEEEPAATVTATSSASPADRAPSQQLSKEDVGCAVAAIEKACWASDTERGTEAQTAESKQTQLEPAAAVGDAAQTEEQKHTPPESAAAAVDEKKLPPKPKFGSASLQAAQTGALFKALQSSAASSTCKAGASGNEVPEH